jgi:hypothetical protein
VSSGLHIQPSYRTEAISVSIYKKRPFLQLQSLDSSSELFCRACVAIHLQSLRTEDEISVSIHKIHLLQILQNPFRDVYTRTLVFFAASQQERKCQQAGESEQGAAASRTATRHKALKEESGSEPTAQEGKVRCSGPKCSQRAVHLDTRPPISTTRPGLPRRQDHQQTVE